MPILIFSFITFSYLLSSILLASYMKSLSPRTMAWTRWLFLLTLLTHWALIARELFAIDNLLNPSVYFSSLLFSALANTFFGFLLFKRKFLILSLLGIPMSSFLVFSILLFEGSFSVLQLPSAWLWTHIFLMIFGQVLFFFAAIGGFVYLVTARKLHERSSFSFLLASAPLPTVDRFIERILLLGWVLMTVGILLGGFFASEFWNTAWWKDAKIIFSIVTWAVYGLFLVLRWALPSIRGVKSAWFMVISFVFVFLFSLGIDYFFQTQHQNLRIERVE